MSQREDERLTMIGYTRNLFAEKILEKLPTPCRFSEHGCGKILLKNDKLIHLKLCPFREVECPQYSCRKPVSLWKLFEHVDEHHPDVELVSPGFEKIYHVSSLLVNDGRQSSNLFQLCYCKRAISYAPLSIIISCLSVGLPFCLSVHLSLCTL
jgi:hypothetical protein